MIADYESQKLGENPSNDDTTLQALSRSSVRCFFCEKPGHQKPNCRKYKKWTSENLQKESSNQTSERGKKRNRNLKESDKIQTSR